MERIVGFTGSNWSNDSTDDALGERNATLDLVVLSPFFQLGWNRLQNLPREIALLRSLQSLDVQHNALECVPPELADLQCLQLLVVSAARLDIVFCDS
jgi:hypothetical protein